MNATPHPIVCIVGAGPYGVSIAAYIRYVGIDFCIFGFPMRRWLYLVPEHMLLKSESCASSLYDPVGLHTLARYCRDEGILYPEYGTITRGLCPIRDLFSANACSQVRQ